MDQKQGPWERWERVVALAGGVGGAKLAEGLQQILGERLTIIGNVADDEEFWGLHVSPDLDTVTYWLAGVNDEARGWGLRGESWHAFETLEAIGAEPWFRLGDRDLATHLYRTAMLREGNSLTEATIQITRGWGMRATLLPVTDHYLRTMLDTDQGQLSFQDYFVRRQWQPVVRNIRFEGAEEASITPQVMEALHEASAVILCPSNPLVSIAPLLAVSPLRETLRDLPVPVVAVSPIVEGTAIKGPAAKLMQELGEEPGALAVARRYADFLDGFLLDERDTRESAAIEQLDIYIALADTLMEDAAGRRRVAEAILNLAASIPVERTSGQVRHPD